MLNGQELDRQARDHKTLSFWKSARAGAVLCLVISMAITVAMIFFRFGGTDASAFVDVAIFAVLAIFIGFGRRWAMIGAMIVWTLEKTFTGIGMMQSGSSGAAFSQVIWLCFYMHAYYFAFRVEQRRRKLARMGGADVEEVFR